MQEHTKQNWSFILMRHAESAHNKKKNWHKSNHVDNNISSYKQTQQYLQTKFSKQFLDPEQIDKKELSEGAKKIDLSQISLILTSPLNRCLQTVKQILSMCSKQRNNDEMMPQVIVDPCLTSRISTAWSTGIDIQKKKEKYPSFNFDQFAQQQRHWILHVLNKDFVQKYKKPNELSETVLQFISEGNLQTYDNVIQRIKEFKWKLNKKYLKLAKGKKILIISHNCLFKYIIGTGLNPKGKVSSQIELQHCEPIFFKDKFILQETFLKPQTKEDFELGIE